MKLLCTNKDPELVALREHVPGHGDAGVVVAGVLDLVLVLAPLLPTQQQHADFRDILQIEVRKTSFFLIDRLAHFLMTEILKIIVWTKKEDCYCRKHVNIS